MAYNIKITNGTTTYTVGANVPPGWAPSLATEVDDSKIPAEVCALIETWELQAGVYVNATAANNTTDFNTLEDLIGNRTLPITSVKLYDNTTEIRSLDTTYYTSVIVTSVKAKAEPGSFTNHWTCDLTVTARRQCPDGSNIVRLERKLTYAYDDAGLLVQTLTGKIETKNGVSALGKVSTYVESSPGASFVLETAGTYNAEVTVENYSEDTICSFRQVYRQIGLTVPSTATNYTLSVEVKETSRGKETSYNVTTRGETIADARTAARAIKPSSKLAEVVYEREGRDHLEYAAQYVSREQRTAAASRYGTSKVSGMKRSFVVSGGGQNFLFDPIPGGTPFVTLSPKEPLTIRETVTVWATNVSSFADCPLPAPLWPDNLQYQDCSETLPEVEGEDAEQRQADLYAHRATRVYAFWEEAPSPATVAQVVFNAPQWQGDVDYWKLHGVRT